jgi:hypothetical protein
MRHVHTRTDEAHPFAAKPRTMSRECGQALCAHDPMARHVGIVAGAHDVPDGARGERTTGDDADETVGRDPPGRDSLHDPADRARPGVRDQSPFPPTGTNSIESDIDAMSGRAR